MSKMTDDRNTITRLRRGDREAFACLYRRYWRKVYHFTSLYITSGADVEEVVQDVFVKLWENRARIDESQSIEGYLFIITRNHVFNYNRQNFNSILYRATLQEAMDETYSMEEEINASNLRERAKVLIQALPPRQREVFLLNRVHDLSYKEIAERLDISVKTVERHMAEALKFLRKHLGTYIVYWIVWGMNK